mmetsp:Transcript_22703/g.52972  ORF Transcript_22703/g.52972 Transcript_22703/m.52972 type:complete len:231 (+) Transcript_22703:634-1326(+)
MRSRIKQQDRVAWSRLGRSDAVGRLAEKDAPLQAFTTMFLAAKRWQRTAGGGGSRGASWSPGSRGPFADVDRGEVSIVRLRVSTTGCGLSLLLLKGRHAFLDLTLLLHGMASDVRLITCVLLTAVRRVGVVFPRSGSLGEGTVASRSRRLGVAVRALAVIGFHTLRTLSAAGSGNLLHFDFRNDLVAVLPSERQDHVINTKVIMTLRGANGGGRTTMRGSRTTKRGARRR